MVRNRNTCTELWLNRLHHLNVSYHEHLTNRVKKFILCNSQSLVGVLGQDLEKEWRTSSTSLVQYSRSTSSIVDSKVVITPVSQSCL